MPWVPFEDSSIPLSYADYWNTMMADSIVSKSAGTGGSEWEIYGGDGFMFRVTALEYAQGPTSASFWWWDENGNGYEQQNEDTTRDNFFPSSFEGVVGQGQSLYYYSDPQEVRQEQYSFLIEVWEGPALVANDDEATTSADTAVTVDVLANDTHYDEPVTLGQLDGLPTIHEQPANGTVSVAPDGKITYTPSPGFTGTDEFVYRIAMPEPSEICGYFSEGFGVISVPEGFSIGEPITFSVGGQSMEMFWVPWAGFWEPDYGGGDSFYPNEGELAVMSQGGNSVEGNLVAGVVLTYAYGQVWMVGPHAPWFEFFVETEDGDTYYAMDNGGGSFAFTDGQPPIPPPGSPYPVKISYQDEVGEHELCGLMVSPTD